MKTLTINEKINFRSKFRPVSTDKWFMRLNRPYYHYDQILPDSFKYSVDIPFIPELINDFKGWSKAMLKGIKK